MLVLIAEKEIELYSKLFKIDIHLLSQITLLLKNYIINIAIQKYSFI